MSGMSKPEDIPQDLWDAAEAALDFMLCNCAEASGSHEQCRVDSIADIARAMDRWASAALSAITMETQK